MFSAAAASVQQHYRVAFLRIPWRWIYQTRDRLNPAVCSFGLWSEPEILNGDVAIA
jgi:hypothetical protein